jgi:hypothetical protein
MGYAHVDLERAMSHAQDAEFDAALTSFGAALASTSLTHEELITLLAERSLVLHALGRKQQLDEDLSALVMLGREDALDRRAPPQLVETLAAKKRTQQPLALQADCAPSALGTKIHMQASGVMPSLAVMLRIHVRDAGAERWSLHDANEVELAPSLGKQIAYYGELLGYGNVVLASVGSVDIPRTCTVVAAGKPSAQPHVAAVAQPLRPDISQRKKWWWLGAGSVLAIGAVTVAVLATRNEEPAASSAPSGLTLRFE